MQGGTEVGRSGPFSVSAIPQDISDTLNSKIDDRIEVAITIDDGWEFDSGSVADLDQAESTEKVRGDEGDRPVRQATHGEGRPPASQLVHDRQPKDRRRRVSGRFGAAATANGIISAAGKCNVSATFDIP